MTQAKIDLHDIETNNATPSLAPPAEDTTRAPTLS